ncbi:hypothetical protein [Billgrantia aerodenitrificans]|uniref:Uncharacterized protein n=1 Tax=Billgrantia aerodenitrificans TaxID=2733483 RepID=A0ABS9AV17_9GAMM|nr:hypothetical protein [Halomonas aerodenitrificans]MCE8025723.1 hypothetical protein [Halomonas aerodenitrificans]
MLPRLTGDDIQIVQILVAVLQIQALQAVGGTQQMPSNGLDMISLIPK